MFIVFGTKTITKDMGVVGTYECSRCHNVSEWRFMQYRYWFTLFFIPVIPVSGKHEYLQCPVCSQAYSVPKDGE